MKTQLQYLLILACYCTLLLPIAADAKQKNDLLVSESIADSYVTTQRFAEAESAYLDILSKETIDVLTYDRVNIKLAAILYSIRKYTEAEMYFGAVVITNTAAFTPQYACDYVNTLIRLGKLQRAADIADQFTIKSTAYNSYQPLQNLIEGLKENCKIDLKTAVTIKEAPFNMPGSNFWCANYNDNILFIHTDSHPSAMIRGAELYLYNGESCKPFAKTYRTLQTGPACFSSDGKKMIYTDNRYRENQIVRAKKNEPVVTNYLNIVELSFDEKTQQWKNPKSIFKDKPFSSICHPALSEDGERLYFAADFTNGTGEMDLYMSQKTSKGWSKPVSLGRSTNTQNNELYPYIYGSTLYFSSNGHNGIGGMDLYGIKLDKEGMPIAETLEHLPYPINTIYNDYALMHSTPQEGFFTSDRPNSGSLDAIYSWAGYVDFAGQEHLIQNASDTAKSTAFTNPNEGIESKLSIAVSVADANTG